MRREIVEAYDVAVELPAVRAMLLAVVFDDDSPLPVDEVASADEPASGIRDGDIHLRLGQRGLTDCEAYQRLRPGFGAWTDQRN